MKRMSMVFLPVLGVGAMLIGVSYMYAGIKALVAGQTGSALFLVVFGFGGIALGLALWNVWRRFVRAIPRAEETRNEVDEPRAADSSVRSE